MAYDGEKKTNVWAEEREERKEIRKADSERRCPGRGISIRWQQRCNDTVWLQNAKPNLINALEF